MVCVHVGLLVVRVGRLSDHFQFVLIQIGLDGLTVVVVVELVVMNRLLEKNLLGVAVVSVVEDVKSGAQGLLERVQVSCHFLLQVFNLVQ